MIEYLRNGVRIEYIHGVPNELPRDTDPATVAPGTVIMPRAEPILILTDPVDPDKSR